MMWRWKRPSWVYELRSKVPGKATDLLIVGAGGPLLPNERMKNITWVKCTKHKVGTCSCASIWERQGAGCLEVQKHARHYHWQIKMWSTLTAHSVCCLQREGLFSGSSGVEMGVCLLHSGGVLWSCWEFWSMQCSPVPCVTLETDWSDL